MSTKVKMTKKEKTEKRSSVSPISVSHPLFPLFSVSLSSLLLYVHLLFSRWSDVLESGSRELSDCFAPVTQHVQKTKSSSSAMRTFALARGVSMKTPGLASSPVRKPGVAFIAVWEVDEDGGEVDNGGRVADDAGRVVDVGSMPRAARRLRPSGNPPRRPETLPTAFPGTA